MSIPSSVEILLQKMVQINTVNTIASGNQKAEAPLTHYLESLAHAMGLHTKRYPVRERGDNLLVYPEPLPNVPGILFMSHLDTVSTANMTIDPCCGKIDSERVWGRGSCDTKGTGASILWALYQLMQHHPRKQNVGIVFTLDEEYGMSGVREFAKHVWPQLPFLASGVIVGEPTMLTPITAHNGIVRWKITTHGVAAHSSVPQRGRSAISDMVKVIRVLEEKYIPNLQASHPMTGKSQCSINIIQGGSQVNIIPDRCEIFIDRRAVPGEDYRAVIPAVKSLLDELAKADAHFKYDLEVLFECPPLEPKFGERMLPVVQRALDQMKLPVAPRGEAYGTEAGDLSDAQIPAIVIGPGDLLKAHSKDEWVAIDQLRKGVEFYLNVMKG